MNAKSKTRRIYALALLSILLLGITAFAIPSYYLYISVLYLVWIGYLILRIRRLRVQPVNSEEKENHVPPS
ncbi:MAG TPA: hypothetical protein VGR53_05635 [Nitrososphaerales archaeon]|nr:hypothetical protein [Nitrososphaerales archaeon]